MKRPDLAQLREEHLIRAASVGLVKRARRELDDPNLVVRVEENDSDIQFHWSDSVICRFPPASSLRGQCSCAAQDLCRHLLRSILYFQTLPEDPAPDASIAPPADPDEVDTLLSADEALLARTIGKSALSRGRRQLGESLVVEAVDRDARQVTFAQPAIVVAFPPQAPFASGICSCSDPPPCEHLTPALLALRGEIGERTPVQHDGLAIRSAFDRARVLIEELLRVGIDGLSPAWCEAATTAALEIDKTGIGVVAELLRRVNNQISSALLRDRPFQPSVLRWNLAALWYRIEQVARTDRPEILGDDLVAVPAKARWSPERRQLVGVGLRAWFSNDVNGITLFLLDRTSGQIVTVGTGRPADLEIPPASLADRAEILGPWTARDLLGRTLVCIGSQLADDDKIRLPKEAPREAPWTADSTLDPTSVDWLALAREVGIDRWDHLAERARPFFPSIITRRRLAAAWFLPTQWEEPTVDARSQAFLWTMLDPSGRTLPVRYAYQPERADAFEQLRLLSEQAKPLAVLGQWHASAGNVRVEPITFIINNEESTQAYIVDIDTWKTTKKKRRGQHV
jgi:hypothetical protein